MKRVSALAQSHSIARRRSSSIVRGSANETAGRVLPWLSHVTRSEVAGPSLTLHGLARRHDLSRTLIRIWIDKYEAGAFDEDAEAADTIQEYEARIAALERLVGKQALDLDFLKGAQRQGRQPGSVPMSVITGPQAPPSPKDGQPIDAPLSRWHDPPGWPGMCAA